MKSPEPLVGSGRTLLHVADQGKLTDMIGEFIQGTSPANAPASHNDDALEDLVSVANAGFALDDMQARAWT